MLFKLHTLFQAAAFLLFCFVGGGWLIYDSIDENRGRLTFDGIFPGVAAIVAGLLAVGLFLRELRADLVAMKGDPAILMEDRERVSTLRERCSELINRLNLIKSKWVNKQ